MKKVIIYTVVAIFLGVSFVVVGRFLTPDSYVKDGIHYSVIGKFQVPVPVTDSWGGKSNETKRSLSFVDDLCSLYRIDYAYLSDSAMHRLKEMGNEKFLGSYVQEVYLKTFLSRTIPGVKIDFKEYRGSKDNGSLYMQIDAPKGSVCKIRRNGGEPTRDDAKRGAVALIYGGRFYVITTSLGVELTSKGVEALHAPTPKGLEAMHASQEQKLKENTLSFSQSITYRSRF